MFAKSIVLSDAFLDMPLSARCLYFTLGMMADDDGFVGNPKSIMRQCGASQDDMLVLLQKRYILSWDSGVIVIKHWRMNNYLQNDRHKSTTYLEELSTLDIDARGAYTEKKDPMYTECIQNVYTGKDSIGKDSIDKVSITNYQEVISMYNNTCVSFPRLRNISENRKKAIKARLKKYSIDDFQTLFEKAEASDFLKGANKRNWSATFDWLINDANMAKVLEGNYDNRVGGKNNSRVEAIDWDNV